MSLTYRLLVKPLVRCDLKHNQTLHAVREHLLEFYSADGAFGLLVRDSDQRLLVNSDEMISCSDSSVLHSQTYSSNPL